jgi:hypothetical protein
MTTGEFLNEPNIYSVDLKNQTIIRQDIPKDRRKTIVARVWTAKEGISSGLL